MHCCGDGLLYWQVKEWVSTDEKKHEFRTIGQIVSQYFDDMGIERGRSDVTLAVRC